MCITGSAQRLQRVAHLKKKSHKKSNPFTCFLGAYITDMQLVVHLAPSNGQYAFYCAGFEKADLFIYFNTI